MRKEHASKINRRGQDVEFETTFYERILKESPDFIEALSALGNLYTKTGLWQKGLEIDLRLSQIRPDDPIVFYNLACSYALLKQTRAALSALMRAIDLGYDDFEHLKEDRDLDYLRQDKQFQQYIKQLEKRKKHSTPS